MLKHAAHFMDFRQTVRLFGSTTLIFFGMMFLRILDETSNEGQCDLNMMLVAIFLLVSGSYKISNIIGSLNDSSVFAFFVTMEKRPLFRRHGGLLGILVIGSLIILSALIFSYASTTAQAAGGALLLSATFPLFALLIRHRSRIGQYRKLSQLNEGTP